MSLRLVFDDPRHPDFILDLWLPEDEQRRDARPPSAAIEEARGWLARAEAILRRAPRVALSAVARSLEDDEPFDDDEDQAEDGQALP